MRILRPRKTLLPLLFIAFTSTALYSQESNITIQQDPKFDQLLKEKRKINSSITVNDRYKIQIFYGDNDGSRKALTDFKRDFKELDGTIIFNSPSYKVWVGNFKTKLEAERNLLELKKKYPGALLIKPNK